MLHISEPTLKLKRQKQNLIHMQVLKVDSEITVLYKIIITVFNIIIKIHLLSTSLYFCVFCKSTIVVVFIQHLESPERRSVSPYVADPLTWLPPIHPPLPRVQMSFTFAP